MPLAVLFTYLLLPCAVSPTLTPAAIRSSVSRISAATMCSSHGLGLEASSSAAAVITSFTDEIIIRERIGEGAHGEVLLGDHVGGRGPVAIKLGLRVGAIAREAAVLSAMSGIPGFPALLHHEAEGERAAGGLLVMELLGPSLEDLWQSSRTNPTRLSTPTVLHAGRGALRCLRQLHHRGFIHNDVKPGNVLLGVDSTRRAAEIHLIDFGLTTRQFEPWWCPTQCGEVIGSPTFASLAAHHHRRRMRPADDIESLVYTLAYLAVGGLPWQGESGFRAMAMKRRMLRDGCGVLTDARYAASDLGADPTPFQAIEALEALWAQVVRSNGESGVEARGPNVDYDACLAALGGGAEEEEAGIPIDDGEDGKGRKDGIVWGV
jgi:serine/threonine protein kinase